MTDGTRACPRCGAAVAAGAKFCGECGTKLAEADPSGPSPGGKPAADPGKPAGPPAHKQTMLGMQSPVSPPAKESEPAEPAEPAPGSSTSKPHKGTMLGMPAVAPPAGAGDRDRSQGPAEETGRDADPFARTPATGLPQTGAAAPRGAKDESHRTMMGMPRVEPPAGGEPPSGGAEGEPAGGASPGPASASPHEPKTPASPKTPKGPSKRTMLGMAGVASEGIPGPGPAKETQGEWGAAPSPAPPSGTGPAEPVAQQQAPQAPAHQPSPAQFSAPAPAAEASGSDASIPGLSRRRGPPLLAIVIGVAALVVVLGAVVAFVVLRSGTDLRASVVQSPQGERLRLEVPGAPEGTKVRFAGQERTLQAGRAELPLSADALDVGDNDLTVDVIHPDGDVQQEEMTLTVDYRVRAELDGLGGDPPTITLVVHAEPGSEVSLQGEPLALDAEGKGSREVALEDAGDPSGPEAVYEHEAEYRIQPPDGEPASGTIRTRIPFTSLQLDRPGEDVITDAEAIEIAGAVHPSAEVTIDGEPVELDDGRFVVQHPLPEPGVHEPTIVARRPDRLPREQTIRIERVEDLEKAAERFRADRDLPYSKIAQNPSIYRGRKIDLTGRIYNVEVGGGKSVLQMLVRGCPAGERCPLWVTYDAATDLTVQRWARVLGEVTGEQQFRAESGRVISVPRVHAKLVLPVKQ